MPAASVRASSGATVTGASLAIAMPTPTRVGLPAMTLIRTLRPGVPVSFLRWRLCLLMLLVSSGRRGTAPTAGASGLPGRGQPGQMLLQLGGGLVGIDPQATQQHPGQLAVVLLQCGLQALREAPQIVESCGDGVGHVLLLVGFSSAPGPPRPARSPAGGRRPAGGASGRRPRRCGRTACPCRPGAGR